jgi:single-stranded-DNA-specific exonuclease
MRWEKKELKPEAVKDLARRYGLDLLAASIFARRGICEPEQLKYYLEDDPRHLHNPFLFSQMEDAVDRILHARDEAEKVLVFGDADSDGITSTVLLYEAFSGLGIDCAWRVPAGGDPYGLSRRAIDDFAATGGSLVVTVDCGISNHQEVDYAKGLGIDVIIVDHHRLQSENPPDAIAVIDPKLPDSGYPFRELAGCGVAYKLATALKLAQTELYKQHIALLNLRPAGPQDAGSGEAPQEGHFILEALRLSNLVETGRISERLVPGQVRLDRAKFVGFLADRQIFVWNGDYQKRCLAAALGQGAEVFTYDLAPEIGALIPSTAGKSLAELRELSRIALYMTGNLAEIDVFRNLFVSFALKRAQCFDSQDSLRLQLVALGTIADLMPLRDENRILVKRGLASINREPREGLAELFTSLQLDPGTMSAHDIAWQITPVINAAGRMGAPDKAVSLFLAKTKEERLPLAAEILAMNMDRRKMGIESWETVLPLARESFARNGEKLSIVGTDKVPRGITGLIASRVMGALKAPAIVASFQPDGLTVGSIRSVRGFPVSALLQSCSDLFIDYGGHDAAAGFSLPAGSWQSFVDRTEAFIRGVDLALAEETVNVDAQLPHDFVTPELFELTRRFEPSGEESPPLVFMSTGVSMVDAQIVGKGEKNHLKLTLDFGRNKWPAMMWDGAERLERDFSWRNRDSVDLLFKVSLNRWNGMETPQIEIIDIRKAESRERLPRGQDASEGRTAGQGAAV